VKRTCRKEKQQIPQLNSAKKRPIPQQNSAARFRGTNQNSAAWLEILLSAEKLWTLLISNVSVKTSFITVNTFHCMYGSYLTCKPREPSNPWPSSQLVEKRQPNASAEYPMHPRTWRNSRVGRAWVAADLESAGHASGPLCGRARGTVSPA